MVKTWDDDEDGGEIVDIVYHDDGGERLVQGEHWSQKPNAPKASASCVYHHGTNPQLLCTTAIRLQNYSPLCCIATCFTLLQYSQPIVYNTNSHNRAQKSFGFARYHCTVINRILQKKLQLFYIRLKHRKPSKQDTASIPQLC